MASRAMAPPSVCRYSFVSSVTGTVPLSIRSPSTRPGPIDGSCAGSPTITRWVPSGERGDQRRRQFDVQHGRLVDDHQVGLDRVAGVVVEHRARSRPATGGRAPSSRCTVVALLPASSSSRFAARPVGAASAIDGVHLAAQRDDRRDGPALAGAGAAGEQADPVRGGQRDRPGLHLVQTLDGALDGPLAGQRRTPSGPAGPVPRRWWTRPAPTPFGRPTARPSRAGSATRTTAAGDQRGAQSPAARPPRTAADPSATSDSRRGGVAVPGVPGQRPLHQRPAAPRVVPADVRFDRAGQPVGLRDGGVGQRQQPPRVGAQHRRGVVAERVGQPGRPADRDLLRHQQFGDLVQLAGADEAGDQPVGPAIGHPRQAGEVRRRHVGGRGDPGLGQLGRHRLPDTRPQAGGAELGEHVGHARTLPAPAPHSGAPTNPVDYCGRRRVRR